MATNKFLPIVTWQNIEKSLYPAVPVVLRQFFMFVVGLYSLNFTEYPSVS